MSPSQVEEMLAIAWLLLATHAGEPMLKILCSAFGLWSLVFAVLHAVRSFAA
jgi:hypothetical protein